MLEVGQTLTRKRVFSQRHFDRFAALSWDDNPIHTDPAFSAGTRFGKPVGHGMLLYAAIEWLLGASFPGAVQLEQELMFPNPTYAGEEVTIRLKVTEVDPVKRLAWLDALVAKSDGAVACQGRTLIRLPE